MQQPYPNINVPVKIITEGAVTQRFVVLKCGKCESKLTMPLVRVLPEEIMDKKIREKGWRPDRRYPYWNCPTCVSHFKGRKSSAPAPVNTVLGDKLSTAIAEAEKHFHPPAAAPSTPVVVAPKQEEKPKEMEHVLQFNAVLTVRTTYCGVKIGSGDYVKLQTGDLNKRSYVDDQRRLVWFFNPDAYTMKGTDYRTVNLIPIGVRRHTSDLVGIREAPQLAFTWDDEQKAYVSEPLPAIYRLKGPAAKAPPLPTPVAEVKETLPAISEVLPPQRGHLHDLPLIEEGRAIAEMFNDWLTRLRAAGFQARVIEDKKGFVSLDLSLKI